jgi:hypothetical protein
VHCDVTSVYGVQCCCRVQWACPKPLQIIDFFMFDICLI